MTRTVAAFDFDGTLTRRDTLAAFLVAVAGWPGAGTAAARTMPLAAQYAARRVDRDTVKEHLLTHALRGRAFSDVAASGRIYGADLARSKLAPEMRARVERHRASGHEIVIVSATLDVYLDEVAATLEATTLLRSALEVDDAGLCTGRLLGANCRGAEKAARLTEWIGGDDVTLWAYGDSAGDDEMLALADYAVRVRRGRPV